MSELDKNYRPQWLKETFDRLGEEEWNRLIRSPLDKISLHIHTEILKAAVVPGATVLELGSGCGRFTEVLSRCGANVVVSDISPKQLALNKEKAAQLGFESSVVDWIELDAVCLERFEDRSFDVIVGFGGLLSYVFEHRNHVTSECFRILNPGGRFLSSVMSLWGTVGYYPAGFMTLSSKDRNRVIDTGDLTEATFGPRGHFCHLFTSHEYEDLIKDHGFLVNEISSSEALSHGASSELDKVYSNQSEWPSFLNLQLNAARCQGCRDIGRHIIIDAIKPA